VRLLADESCDFNVVVGLRAAGHDVTAVIETMTGAEDERVIALAASERRLLLTEDKDFGQLVFAAAALNAGVILIRYPSSARSGLNADLLRVLAERSVSLYGCFVVAEPGRTRITAVTR
jgi:predicted nuclease of predicted toxin-antitoxin system